MRKICLTAMTLAIHCISSAQGWQPAGARSMSMANSSVALSDEWSYHHNPGATAFLKHTSAGISYENRYLLKELQMQALVVVHPLKTGVLSAGAQSYGYQSYRTTRAGLGYSLRLGEKLAAGVQLNYQGMRIERYGSRSTVTAEAGFLAKITPKTAVGFSVMNIGRSRLAEFRDERFATLMRLGMSYQATDKVIVLLEAEKALRVKLRMKGALEYELISHFYMRTGAACNPTEITFGFGYHTSGRLMLDLGSAWRQQLGWSPHFGLNYHLKPRTHE